MTSMPREPITNAELAAPYDWCIAGGFAACPDKAGDCDVWVLTGGDESLGSVRDGILQRLQALDIAFVEESTPFSDVLESYATGVNIGTTKCARLADGRQIIVTTADSASELLDAFDVSAHQIALTSDGELVRGSGFTPIDQPVRALLRNEYTDSRLTKIACRYRQVAMPVTADVPVRGPLYLEEGCL